MPDRQPGRADASGDAAQGEIERTGREAERLLEALESPPSRRRRSGRRRSAWLAWLLIAVPLALLGLPALREAVGRGAAVLAPAPLRHRASCGSSDSADGVWWPVLGPADPSLLRRVRQDYCGDAYINGQGHLQVASFARRDEAERFARRLSAATGAPFRSGRR
jgi:hypothetical protein